VCANEWGVTLNGEAAKGQQMDHVACRD
jgi:hypothetical protein